ASRGTDRLPRQREGAAAALGEGAGPLHQVPALEPAPLRTWAVLGLLPAVQGLRGDVVDAAAAGECEHAAKEEGTTPRAEVRRMIRRAKSKAAKQARKKNARRGR